MQTITVKASSTYPIHIGRGLLGQCGELIRSVSAAKRAVIMTDDIVSGLYGDAVTASLLDAGFEVLRFVFPNGETQKSHTTLLAMYEFLAQHQLTRKDLLIALGGGVVGDITGFCAASFLRGMDFVQIPTTLLAQIDSSVGGKTGVNIEGGKNLVGAFKQPICVLCDADTLSTLSDEIFADGVAEAVKYGMILSPTLFGTLAQGDAKAHLEEIITTCVSIKQAIVENDEFDTGERMLLNFGHTLGHAIEQYYHYTGITHGKAVSIGMCVFTRLAESYAMCKAGVSEQLARCLQQYGLPTDTDIPVETLLACCLRDKKRVSGTMNIILCKDIGSSAIVKLTVPEFEAFLTGGLAVGH